MTGPDVLKIFWQPWKTALPGPEIRTAVVDHGMSMARSTRSGTGWDPEV